MEFLVLASGSKGNSTLIDFGSCRILVDCGISKRALNKALNDYGYCLEDIDYCFLTHDHSDHCKYINLFPKNMVYTAKGCLGDLNEDHYFMPYELYEFKDVKVIPLKTSHDATNGVGFLFLYHDEKLVYMTDTGYISKKNASYMVDADYYIIESNHDVDLLMQSDRSMYLKNRILSDRGHLSNLDSAKIMSRLVGGRTKEIILAHLSEECNTSQKAIETYQAIFSNANINLASLQLKVACQKEVVRGGNNEN